MLFFFPACLQAGAPHPLPGRRLQGRLPSQRGEGFTFFGSTVRQAICLNNPKENHLAKLLVSKQFTSLVFKQTPTLAPCLVPGRGLASHHAQAQCPAPTPRWPEARAAAQTSLQTTLGVTCGQ